MYGLEMVGIALGGIFSTSWQDQNSNVRPDDAGVVGEMDAWFQLFPLGVGRAT